MTSNIDLATATHPTNATAANGNAVSAVSAVKAASLPGPVGASPAEPEFIERDELRLRLDRGEPVVVLEALPERYYRKAHLPGALLMPHDRVDELAASLIPSLASAVVVYCASETCRNSDQAAVALQRLGYRNVRVYRGGKADWQAAGLPVAGG